MWVLTDCERAVDFLALPHRDPCPVAQNGGELVVCVTLLSVKGHRSGCARPACHAALGLAGSHG